MDSYKRFSDEKYKYWLQTAESLFILRSDIREFVENETENYHQSLREKLKDEICRSNCSFHKHRAGLKKGFPQLCDNCDKWKKAILDNHNSKGMDIHWNNCQPNLWSTDKWEVAKVYMLRGTKDHHSFDEFDISAILNFMSHCKHFKAFIKGHTINKVISVRNKVMHSPDFTLNKEDMDDSIKNILEVAKILENHAPGLKNISEKIKKFGRILEKCSEQASQNTEDSKGVRLKLLDREQDALKEKINFLAKCYEEDQNKELKEELQGMKDFLDQNKDLLENLGPQLQEKLNRLEQDISNLNDRVEWLEQKMIEDPTFSGDTLMYKNHVYEETRKRKMPEPEFTEEKEPSGYRGIATVNGCKFTGSQLCKSKRLAHQEVAAKILDYMKSHPDWEGETIETTSSISASSSIIFYGIVTVDLNNQEVESDWCDQEQEATESAYRKLACQFRLTVLEGNDYKTAVLEHFQSCKFPPPAEHPVCQGAKFLCKLQISGSFTFYDKEGASKRKQADEQAAKVALHHLSGLFNRSFEAEAKNYRVFLKECLDAHHLKSPVYTSKEGDCYKVEVPNTSGPNLPSASYTTAISKNGCHQPMDIVSQECVEAETQDESPDLPNKSPIYEYTDINKLLALFLLKPPSVTVEGISTDFRCHVAINLDKFTFQNNTDYTVKKDAFRKTYLLLGKALGISQENLDENNASMLVKQDFSQKNIPHPKDHFENNKCSLIDITYTLVYNGEGSSEEEAKLCALQRALDKLTLLFGFKSLPKCEEVKGQEEQINALLRANHQRDFTYSDKGILYKISVELMFKDYTMESKQKKRKKENNNHLCSRILGLLAVNPGPKAISLRNCLDEWFIQKNLEKPEFGDTEEEEEPHGSKVTFSVRVSCSTPNWEDSRKVAEEKLVDELKKRFTYLSDNAEDY